MPFGGQGNEFGKAAFSRDLNGVVRLRGLVGRSANEADPGFCHIGGPIPSPDDIFELPPGHRPSSTATFGVRSNGGPGEVRVEPDGDVLAVSGDYHDVSLDGITFRCEPSGEDGCP